jgi:hypothetical protein
MDGVMNKRTTSVSNSRPIMIVVPNWPTMRRSLVTIEPMVNANTRPAVVTTRAGAAHRADDYGFEAGSDSSWNRETSSRL